MAPVKLGLVGTGPRGRVYVNAVKQINERTPGRAEYIGACDIDPQKLSGFCQRHDLASDQVHNALELASVPEIDAMVICTPDNTHEGLAKMAYDHGKHVLVEKPIAISPEGARRVCEAALKAHKVLMSGFVLRYDPLAEKMRELVQGGAIGKLLGGIVHEAVGFHHGASYFRRWHRLRQFSGDLLLHKGCHTLDLFNWITGVFPHRVAAFGGTEVFLPRDDAAMACHECSVEDCFYREALPDQEPAERSASSGPGSLPIDACVYNVDKDSTDTVFLVGEFDSRVRLSYTMTVTSQLDERRFDLIGTGGEIIANMSRHAYGMQIRRLPDEEPEEVPIEMPEGGGHVLGDTRLMEDFLARIEAGADPEEGIEYAYHSGSVAFAAIESIQTGGMVEIPPL